MKYLLIAIVLFTLGITINASHIYKKGTFTFEDGNMMKVRLMEDNSITYELYIPNDGKVKVSTILGDGSNDSFVLSLNKTEIILENYMQKNNSDKANLKPEGEYLLISKNFEEMIFKIRRFIFVKDQANTIVPIDGKFIIGYKNEDTHSEVSDYVSLSEILYFKLDLNKRELRRLDSGNLDSLKIHGVGLYVAWTLLSYMMLITGRYMKIFYWWRMILHAVFGFIILILTIIFVSMADGDGKSSNSFGDTHASFTSLTFPWLIFELISGVVVKIALIFFVHASWIGMWGRVIHMWSSYGCIIANNLVVLSGIYAYGSPLANYMYLHWGIMIIVTIALEVTMRLTSKWKYDYIHQLDKKNLKEITMEEFLGAIKNGKKWALFDDYVVDMTIYYWEHPGSTYVLKEGIGCDLGKYFYGSYTMENLVKPVTHSRIAGKILFKLIIGKIKHNPNIYKVFSPIANQNEQIQQGSTFMFKVKEKVEITKTYGESCLKIKSGTLKSSTKDLISSDEDILFHLPKIKLVDIIQHATVWDQRYMRSIEQH